MTVVSENLFLETNKIKKISNYHSYQVKFLELGSILCHLKFSLLINKLTFKNRKMSKELLKIFFGMKLKKKNVIIMK